MSVVEAICHEEQLRIWADDVMPELCPKCFPLYDAARLARRRALALPQGRKGEPGSWNGAEPVKALIAERDALKAALRATQFGFNHCRCPVCAGWDMGPNGETNNVHTPECPVGIALQ